MNDTYLRVLLSNPLILLSVLLLIIIGIKYALKWERKQVLLTGIEFQKYDIEKDTEVTFFRDIAWQDYAILCQPLSHIVQALDLYKGIVSGRKTIIFLFSRGHMHDQRSMRRTKWIAYIELDKSLPDFYLSSGLSLEKLIARAVPRKVVSLPHAKSFDIDTILTGPEPERVEKLFDLELTNLVTTHPVADLEVVDGNLVIEFNLRMHSLRNIRQIIETTQVFAKAFSKI